MILFKLLKYSSTPLSTAVKGYIALSAILKILLFYKINAIYEETRETLYENFLNGVVTKYRFIIDRECSNEIFREALGNQEYGILAIDKHGRPQIMEDMDTSFTHFILSKNIVHSGEGKFYYYNWQTSSPINPKILRAFYSIMDLLKRYRRISLISVSLRRIISTDDKSYLRQWNAYLEKHGTEYSSFYHCVYKNAFFLRYKTINYLQISHTKYDFIEYEVADMGRVIFTAYKKKNRLMERIEDLCIKMALYKRNIESQNIKESKAVWVDRATSELLNILTDEKILKSGYSLEKYPSLVSILFPFRFVDAQSKKFGRYNFISLG
ncbi:hypothetical protein ENBRE01_3132, partial [Enteropsectra breve]